MPKVSSIVPDSNISILMKGPFGIGKTIAAASFAALGPIYIAYFDKQKPIELLTFYKRYRPELLDRMEFESFSSHNANMFLNRMIGFTKDCRYVAVIVDSVTNLTSAAVNWSMGFRDPKGGKKDKLAGGGADNPLVIPDFDEYKVETSLVTQALDIARTLPVYNIWVAHPVPSTRIEGSGPSMKVTKQVSIVSYGNKVGAMLPGAFTEIYHFGRQMDKRIVWTDMVGDDFAKTCFGLPKELDITDRLFYEVWKEQIDKSLGVIQGLPEGGQSGIVNPFDTGTVTASKWKV